MKKSLKHRSLTKDFLGISLLIVVVFYMFSTFLLSQAKVYAFQNNDTFTPQQQNQRTLLYALGVCLDSDFNVRNYLTPEEVASENILTRGKNNDKKVSDVSVGHEITSDGIFGCDNKRLIREGLKFVGLTPKDMVEAMYTKKVNGGETTYELKKNGRQDFEKRLVSLRADKRQKEGANTVDGDPNYVMGPAERDRRYTVALSRCVKLLPTDAETNDKVFTMSGKKYVYREGMGAKDLISAGHDMQTDGKYGCETLIDMATKSYKYLDKLPNGVTLDMVYKNPTLLLEIASGKSVEDAISGGGNDGNNPETLSDCEKTGNPLTWILCPVYNGVEAATNKLLETTHNILYTDTSELTDGNSKLRMAWGSLRNMANGVFVVSLLVVIIGQAIKGDF